MHDIKIKTLFICLNLGHYLTMAYIIDVRYTVMMLNTY
jgi:hypothetical protein